MHCEGVCVNMWVGVGLGKCMCGCTGVCAGELVFSVYVCECVILCLGR